MKKWLCLFLLAALWVGDAFGMTPSQAERLPRGGVRSATMTGNETWVAGNEVRLQKLDPGGSARTITLPAEENGNGLWYFVKNEADAAETITIQDDASATVCSLTADQACIVACNGTAWYLVAQWNDSSLAIASATFAAITGSDSSLGITGLAVTGGTGGAVALTGGATTTSGVGGAVSLTGGAGSGTDAGGAASVVGGASGAGATGNGGAVAVTGGAAASTNGAGGAVTATGGAGSGTGAGGALNIVGGASGAGATGDGGDVNLTGGASGATNGNGGSNILTPGAKAGSGIAGGNFLRSATGMHFKQQTAAGAGTDQNETLTAAQMINGIFVHTISTGRTLTTPTGAQISAGCPADLAVGDSFELTVITVGTGADDIVTLTAGDGDVTFVGAVTVGPDIQATEGQNGFATWIFRNTGTNTWVGYRKG